MASDDEIAEIRTRLALIEQRLGIVWAPDVPSGTPIENARPSPGASRHPLPEGEGLATATQPAPAPASQALETRIGAHWLNRVGIAAVLFGAAFFLKYAFANDWIGPSTRVAIGAAVGIALLGWAEVL